MSSLVYLIERDVGGYEYMLLAMFTKRIEAERYEQMLREQSDWPDLSIRSVQPLAMCPDGILDPLCWGRG